MDTILKYSSAIICAMIITAFFLLLPELRACKLEGDGDKRRLCGRDYIIMLLITLLYGLTAFYKLGDMQAPESFANMEGRTLYLQPELSAGQVHSIMVYDGVGLGTYSLDYTTDGSDSYHLADVKQEAGDVLKWHRVDLDYYITGGTVTVSGRGNVWLGELVMLSEEGRPIPYTCEEAALNDEGALCPEKQSFMNSSYFDEIYHARTAWEHINKVPPYEITHPPLGKLIISLGIRLFGMNPFGWRFSGTLLGALMLPLMYIFAKAIFGGFTVPAACTLLLAGDFMHFVQTRIATIDTYAVFFILLMYLFMYLFIQRGGRKYLALCGIAFGLGAASKWTCMYAGAGLALIWLIWVIKGLKSGRLDGRGLIKNIGFCLIFFVLIPVLVYLASYYPYGQARRIPFMSGDYIRMVWDNQTYMFNYHSGIVAEHPYASRWYQWVLNIRPILYYLEYFPDGTRSSFGALVNPALCWGGLMSLFVLIFAAIYRRDVKAGFLLMAYFAQLLPWVFVSRITFEYHYFPCAAILCLCMGYVFNLLRQNDRWGKIYIWLYVIFSTALFVIFYPALSGKLVEASTRAFKWLPTWPF